MVQNTHKKLRQEVEYFYHCLFGGDAPPELIAYYLDAHEILLDLRDLPADQLRTVHDIVEKKLDAAAIEPWLRCKGSRHALSAKLLLIAYLVECGAGRQPGQFQHISSGWVALVSAALGGFVGLLRGRYLKARHGLI